MPKLSYCGFEIAYEVSLNNSHLYQGEGFIVKDPDNNPLTIPQKFHTEDAKKINAENEIVRMLKEYIDFEISQYREMKNEKNVS